MNDDDFDELFRAQHDALKADIAHAMANKPIPYARPKGAHPLSLVVARRRASHAITRLKRSKGSLAGATVFLTCALAVLAFTLLPTADQQPYPSGVALPTPRPPTTGTPCHTCNYKPVPPAVRPAQPDIATTTAAPMAATPPPLQPSDSVGERAAGPGTATVQAEPILFLPNSAELTPAGRDYVSTLAGRLSPTDTIHIKGHTARIGNADTAQKLSLRRAQAVEALLVSRGVTAPMVVVGVGFDESPAVSDEATADRSRRVDIRIERHD